jgi:hypothetical protein
MTTSRTLSEKYNVSYERLPEHMQAGARRYIEQGIPPGGFLEAVLANDLVGAFARADEVNRGAMRAWTLWLYNDIPSSAWGDPSMVDEWMEQGGLEGRNVEKGSGGS